MKQYLFSTFAGPSAGKAWMELVDGQLIVSQSGDDWGTILNVPPLPATVENYDAMVTMAWEQAMNVHPRLICTGVGVHPDYFAAAKEWQLQ